MQWFIIEDGWDKCCVELNSLHPYRVSRLTFAELRWSSGAGYLMGRNRDYIYGLGVKACNDK